MSGTLLCRPNWLKGIADGKFLNIHFTRYLNFGKH